MARKKDKYMKNYTMLVSGLLLAFNMAAAEELKLPSVQPLPALVERDGKFYQPVTISLDYKGGPADASLQIGEAAAASLGHSHAESGALKPRGMPIRLSCAPTRKSNYRSSSPISPIFKPRVNS